MSDQVSALSVKGIERALVASVLVQGTAWRTVTDLVRREDLEDPACCAVFEAYETMIEFGDDPGQADIVSLAQWLAVNKPGAVMQSASENPERAWTDWLVASMQLVTSGAFVMHQALTVAKASLGRQLMRELSSLRADLDAKSPVDHDGHERLLDTALARVQQMVDQARKRGAFVSLHEIAEEEVKAAQNPSMCDGAFRYGLRDVDAKTRGLHRGEFVVIGGPSSGGKSTLVNQVAMNVAEQGGKVLVYSLEMGPAEVVKRCLSNMSGIDLFHLQRPLNQGEIDGLELMRQKMSAWEFVVSKAQKCDVSSVCAEARMMKQRKGLDVLVVDYLQLLTSPPPRGQQQSRATEIDTIARRLKMLAQELDCVVIAASQLNADGKFRESRGIEQNANTGFVCGPVDGEEGVLKLELQKQRHGERNVEMKLRWHKPTFAVKDASQWPREEAIFS